MPMPRKYETAAARQSAYRSRCSERGGTHPEAIPRPLGRKRWTKMFCRALCLVDEACEEMQGYYDRRSEAWQDSERGEAFAEAMESAAEVSSALRDMPPL